jgi:alcohol dehydrogenase class IV
MALINYITQINLDFGAISTLRAECERLGLRKPLIVTDAGVRAAGVLDRAPIAMAAKVARLKFFSFLSVRKQRECDEEGCG